MSAEDLEKLAAAMSNLFTRVTSASNNFRFIITTNQVMRMVRRYRPKPNRCKRPFKLRKMRKAIK